jgi:hypothetical protein
MIVPTEIQKCPVCERPFSTSEEDACPEKCDRAGLPYSSTTRAECLSVANARLAERVLALEGERDAARREGWLAGREAAAMLYDGKAEEQRALVARITKMYGGHLPRAGSEHESERYNRKRWSLQLQGVAAEIRALQPPAAPALPEKPPQEAQAAGQKGSE